MMCIWPECTRAAVRGEYCFEHRDLLVYSGAIEAKELDKLLARATERAKAELARRFPDNPDFWKWDDAQDGETDQ